MSKAIYLNEASYEIIIKLIIHICKHGNSECYISYIIPSI